MADVAVFMASTGIYAFFDTREFKANKPSLSISMGAGETSDDSPRLQAGGFWNDAGVSSHTIRSVHAHERAELKTTHALHGTIVYTVVL